MAPVVRESQVEHARNGQSRNTAVRGLNEDYKTQLPADMEGGVTMKLSQDFSKTEMRFLGAFSKFLFSAILYSI